MDLKKLYCESGTQTMIQRNRLSTCRDHTSMMGMLSRVIQDGFDLAGVRLLYPTSDLMKMTEGAAGRNTKTLPLLDKSRQLEVLNNIGKLTGSEDLLTRKVFFTHVRY